MNGGSCAYCGNECDESEMYCCEECEDLDNEIDNEDDDEI